MPPLCLGFWYQHCKADQMQAVQRPSCVLPKSTTEVTQPRKTSLPKVGRECVQPLRSTLPFVHLGFLDGHSLQNGQGYQFPCKVWDHGRAWTTTQRVGGWKAGEGLLQKPPGSPSLRTFPSALCCGELPCEQYRAWPHTSCQKVKSLPFYSLL